MSYANDDLVCKKLLTLQKDLIPYLQKLKRNENLFFLAGETVYIPDVHGDFVHLLQVLYIHGLLNENLNLDERFEYVFLGDIYDRSPDSDLIDNWLNGQIEEKKVIYRLIGNHELAFLMRDSDGSPLVFPSQDSIKDIARDFSVTHELLENIANGNFLAAYVNPNEDMVNNLKTLYVHSYVIDDDFVELGLAKNSDVEIFAQTLNEKFKLLGKKTLEVFLDGKKKNNIDWQLILEIIREDPLFNFYGSKQDIDTSFMCRRTGIPTLKTYPAELDVNIPSNIYQIVGHTPVFSFNLPGKQPINKPFVLNAKAGNGKVQFSDVGIGYYYNAGDFKRPEVVINKKFAVPLIRD